MTLRITSLQNARVKALIKLRERKGRVRQQRIVIDGRREIQAALRGGVQLDQLFLEAREAELHNAIRAAAAAAGAEILLVDHQVFAKLSFGDREDGVVATAIQPSTTLDAIDLPPNPLIVVLEGVEKPGNIGAALRTADAAGASAMILADPVSDLHNPNAIRASLGAIFSMPIAAAASPDVASWLRARGITIVAARVDGAVDYTQIDLRGSVALVLGSEADGLSEQWRGADIQAVSLPMRGTVDSLNVSATTAVLLYEAVRQRTNTPDHPS